MGRIDDALRRAGALPQQGSERAAERDEVFVGAWTFAEGPAERAGGPPRALPRMIDSESPDSAPRFHVVRSSPTEGSRPGWKERLSSSRDVDPVLAEQFRRLAATLFESHRVNGVKAVMVTSAAPGDGKTLTALNLALALSESYRQSVLLIDADLRRPSICDAINLKTEHGLSEALRSHEGRKTDLVPLSDTLTLLPGGRPDPDPLSTLTSPHMKRLLDEARSRFDWIVMDTPPVGAAADAGLLCPMVDAALLVVRAGRTPWAAVQRAVETLGRERILGIVLNGVEEGLAPSEGYYHYYYQERVAAKEESTR